MDEDYAEKQDSIYPPTMIMQGSKADLLDKINPNEIVEIIRHKLMGEEFINGKWIKQEFLKERALTELGAWDIANLMLAVSNRNVSISKLDDGSIRKRATSIADTAINLCLTNIQKYGLGKDPSQLRFINEIVFSTALITLKQPEGEGIRKMIMGTISENKTEQSLHQSDKRGGLFGLLRR